MDVAGEGPFVFCIAAEGDVLDGLYEELDVFLAYEPAVDVDLLYASVKAYIYVLPLAFMPAGLRLYLFRVGTIRVDTADEILSYIKKILPAGVLIPAVVVPVS